jgi:hypothetical protein
MLRSILHWTTRVTALAVGLLIAYAMLLGEDWVSALRSPETMRDAKRIVVLSDSHARRSYDHVSVAPPALRGLPVQDLWHALDCAATPFTGLDRDFDGDGTLDRIEVEYYHQEPMFSASKSGMVIVSSGATGEPLLAYAVDCPMNPVAWCGDVDGNGTEDVLVVENARAVVIGSERRRTGR